MDRDLDANAALLWTSTKQKALNGMSNKSSPTDYEAANGLYENDQLYVVGNFLERVRSTAEVSLSSVKRFMDSARESIRRQAALLNEPNEFNTRNPEHTQMSSSPNEKVMVEKITSTVEEQEEYELQLAMALSLSSLGDSSASPLTDEKAPEPHPLAAIQQQQQ